MPGNPSWTPTTLSNYNATPPADDGSLVEANRITWAKIKDKIGDRLHLGHIPQNTEFPRGLLIRTGTRHAAALDDARARAAIDITPTDKDD